MTDYTYSFVGYLAEDIVLTAPLLVGLLLLILVLGLLIGRLESWSILDSIYHAMIAATTVGYGDFRPSHPASKVLAIMLALAGIIFTGLLVALCIHATQLTFALYDRV